MLADPMSPDAVEYRVNVIPMNFRLEMKPDRKHPGQMVQYEVVDLVKKGSGASTPWTIKELKQDRLLWPAVEPYYEHWQKGQEPPEDGTPVDVLPFLPPTVVGHLKNLHIRTAEDLATTPDADMERIGMGARTWREKAKAFLENQSGADLAAENAQLRESVTTLEGEVEELRAMVNELADKKPGRKKAAAE